MRTSTKATWDNFWKQKSDIGEVYSNTDRIRKNLLKLTSLSGKMILEVGAGTGRDSMFMALDGASIFLVDYSMNSLKIIKDGLRDEWKNMNAIGADAFSLPFQDRTFDIVFHQGLLEHFRDIEAVNLLKENIRVLKNGGLLVVDVPQRWHIYTLIKHLLITFNAWFAGWEREFSVRELRSILSGLGLMYRHAYGEWMYPSLCYRIIREVFLKIGIRLPLCPRLFPPLSRLREKVRTELEGTKFQLYSALSIGIIAEKS